MVNQLFYIMSCIILLSSCKPQLDVAKNSLYTDYMTFKYERSCNKLDYFNKVNVSTDKNVFYTSHFSISLPKKLVYWKITSNMFYFEYRSKQIIYLYTAYKNKGDESEIWETRDFGKGKEYSYLNEYWVKERRYNQNKLYNRNKNRITKLYTNGKYEILLYNIKKNKYLNFLEAAMTFNNK